MYNNKRKKNGQARRSGIKTERSPEAGAERKSLIGLGSGSGAKSEKRPEAKSEKKQTSHYEKRTSDTHTKIFLSDQVSDSKKGEILFGFNSVSEAVRAGRRRIDEIMVSRDRASEKIEKILSETGKNGIRIKEYTSEQITSLVRSEMHQGIAARVGSYPVVEFEDLADFGNNEKAPLFLLLDSLEDPHNFGALCRTALATGADVIIPKDRAVSPTPAVSRVSAGAMEHLRISVVTNLVNAMKYLKDRGVWISGLDGNGEKSIFDSDFKGATGLVVGGEDSGLRELVRKNCDFLVSIPQAGPVHSLNASVAGAVALYEVLRQRAIK